MSIRLHLLEEWGTEKLRTTTFITSSTDELPLTLIFASRGL